MKANRSDTEQSDVNAIVKDMAYSMLKCWKSDPNFPVCIWDNLSQDVFSRKPILDEIQSDEVLVCAIHMNRDLYFCKKNNNNSDRYPVPDKVINIWARRYQQPIYEEGFHVIYHIDGTHKLTPEKFIKRVMEFPLDIYGLKQSESS